jgi:integrase
MFNLAIDTKLRGCDLIALRVDLWRPTAMPLTEPNVRQSKNGRPVRSELTEPTRQALDDYLRGADRKPGEYLFPGLRDPGRPLTTRQYARLVSSWVAGIGLDPRKFATFHVEPKRR